MSTMVGKPIIRIRYVPKLATKSIAEMLTTEQPVPEPAAPNPLPALDFAVQLDYSGNPVAGIPVPGSFLGISIEMSLSEAVIGRNASWLRPQFLNLMSTLKERGGPPVLRVGGNSQEKAYLVEDIGNGAHSTERQLFGPRTPTNTPTLLFTKAIFEAMRAVSDILDIHWYLGMPMNQTQPARLEIVEVAEPILGPFLRVRWITLILPYDSYAYASLSSAILDLASRERA